MNPQERIVIVGAGPVGLVTALWLAKLGTPSLVLETSATVPRDLRASTVHPPTLEMLEELGVLEEYKAMGVIADRWQLLHLSTRERVVFDLGMIKDHTRHPYRLQCEQHKLAPLLNARAQASPLVEIIYGATVTAASQDANGATAIADIGGEKREFAGRYLVGADGAHSAVRQSLEYKLDGFTYPAATTLITTTFRFEEHIPELLGANYCWTTEDAGSMFRLADEWRCTFYPRPSEPVDMEMTPDILQSRMQGILPRDVPYEIREQRSYNIHQRIVDNYRKGRIVLAGDAAHLTPPTGGLGMNGGIHDAVNLAEKLHRVMRGESDDLLDLYVRQRRPVAVGEILAQSHANRIRMQLWDAEERKKVMVEMHAIADDPVRAKAMLLRSSMIDGLRKAAETT